ncbi:MAG: Hpt domain-containing protein [Holophaga sp.]|nr:Hpt domain-containing protein [Holophaga sp.]
MNLDAVPSLEILDQEVMRQLLDLDDGELGLINEMCVLFREDTPPRMAQLEEGICAKDGEQIGDMAHAVKGAASTMGAPRVRALAQMLETGGRTGIYPGDPTEILEKLKIAFTEALAALEQFIASKS